MHHGSIANISRATRAGLQGRQSAKGAPDHELQKQEPIEQKI